MFSVLMQCCFVLQKAETMLPENNIFLSVNIIYMSLIISDNSTTLIQLYSDIVNKCGGT